MNPLSAIRAANPYDAAMAPGITGPLTPGAPAQEIEGIRLPAVIGEPPPVTPAFGSLLGQLVEGVNDKQLAAGQTVSGLLGGQNVSLHQAMLAMEEANVSFQLMVEVRNKLLEAYQELMRMQI